MLRELHVRNLAVLAEASVSFGEGLNVLSGETGAGKSIVVDSLFLLAGARASTDLIRSGAEVLTAAGIFSPSGSGWREVLEAAGLDASAEMEMPAATEMPAGKAGEGRGGGVGDAGEGGAPELLVRREIGRNGRNRVFVNDQPTTLRLLAELAPYLLRIHGQRDEMDLMAAELQRGWLDRSGGAEGEALLARSAAAFDLQERLAERLERLSGDDRMRRERVDLLRFQAAEIDAARLQPGEDQALRQEREVLRHVEAIRQALGTAANLLSEDEGAAVERLDRGRALLAAVEEWEPDAAAWAAELEELRIRTAEVAGALARRLAGLEAEPGRLDAVEDRLALVERLCKRHGGDVAAVLARRAEIAVELADLEGDGDDREELAARLASALAAYRDAALELSRARQGWGERLARAIETELADHGLGRARLSVALERRRRAGSRLALDGEPLEFGRQGIDQVTFLFAPNPGEEPRPLARIASGGELSRLHLALQLAVRDGERRAAAGGAQPTLVFDEVDSGIGGAEAAALGRKLQRLARGGQILAVTHLAQVASHADLHFKVSKRVRGGRTSVEVKELPPPARVEEIARMLAGETLTPLSLSHAEELIAGAQAPEPPRGSRAARGPRGAGGSPLGQ